MKSTYLCRYKGTRTRSYIIIQRALRRSLYIYSPVPPPLPGTLILLLYYMVFRLSMDDIQTADGFPSSDVDVPPLSR